jgi:hypothetical protein
VTVSVAGDVTLTNALTGQPSKEVPATVSTDRRRPAGPPRTTFKVTVPPHSYLVFATQKK